MQIRIHEKSDIPIYQQIVDIISRNIENGSLQPGYKLPTVRDLADRTGVSRGTVKHAYDRLEQLGLVQMTQGRGTFVCSRTGVEPTSKKERAMRLIEGLLDEMSALSFSPRDIRIFFDLKLREREAQYPDVRVGVVDCNPEALSVFCNQLSAFPNVEIRPYLLDDIIDTPRRLDEHLDLIVTTSNHFLEVEYRIPDAVPLMQFVPTVSSDTVLQLARLEPYSRVGVVTASNKFASIISRACEKFCTLDTAPDTFQLGHSHNIAEFAARHSALLLPTNYYKYCSRAEENALVAYAEGGGLLICYDYLIDRGSMLYIGEQIERIYTSRQGGVLP